MYCGKIASTLDDEIITSLLHACGKVKSWKRTTDPETKEAKSFGFCEFEDADGVLRSLRFLNGLKIDGQELLLKGNSATQKYIEEYEQNKVRPAACTGGSPHGVGERMAGLHRGHHSPGVTATSACATQPAWRVPHMHATGATLHACRTCTQPRPACGV